MTMIDPSIPLWDFILLKGNRLQYLRFRLPIPVTYSDLNQPLLQFCSSHTSVESTRQMPNGLRIHACYKNCVFYPSALPDRQQQILSV